MDVGCQDPKTGMLCNSKIFPIYLHDLKSKEVRKGWNLFLLYWNIQRSDRAKRQVYIKKVLKF